MLSVRRRLRNHMHLIDCHCYISIVILCLVAWFITFIFATLVWLDCIRHLGGLLCYIRTLTIYKLFDTSIVFFQPANNARKAHRTPTSRTTIISQSSTDNRTCSHRPRALSVPVIPENEDVRCTSVDCSLLYVKPITH